MTRSTIFFSLLLSLFSLFALSACNSDDLCENLKLYKIGLCEEPEPDYFEVGILLSTR